MVWGGTDDAHGQLTDIAKHVKLAPGDTIVTSSFSAIFPEGVMIGVIDRVNPETSDNFQDIDVKLSTPFASLSYVYIVGNLYKEEQRALEDSLSNDR